MQRTLPQKQPRQSNFELLRILSMLAIVFFHYSCWIFDYLDLQGGSINYVLYWSTRLLGQLGNSIFVLISGYFMVKTEFSLRRVLRMWAEVMFYSLSLLVLRVLLGWRPTGMQLYHLLAPTVAGQYAFMTYFIILSLFAPFLNKMLHTLTRDELRRLNILMFVIFGVLGSVLPGGFAPFTWLGTFIFLYCLAGYLRLYPDSFAFFRRPSRSFAAVALVVALQLVWIYLCGILGARFGFMHPDRFADMRTVPQMVLSLFLFLGFAQLRIPHSRAINRVASGVLAIYLIHYSEALRGYVTAMLKYAFGNGSLTLLLTRLLALSLATCVVCVPIDLLRQRFLEPLYMRLIDRLPPVRRELAAKQGPAAKP